MSFPVLAEAACKCEEMERRIKRKEGNRWCVNDARVVKTGVEGRKTRNKVRWLCAFVWCESGVCEGVFDSTRCRRSQ